MKKLMAMLLVAGLSTSLLAGCGSSSSGSTTESSTETSEAVSTEGATEVATEVSGSSAPEWASYDELIATIKSSTDLVEREALMHEAEDMLMDTGAVLPIYYYNDIFMMKGNLTGLKSNQFGYKFFNKVEGSDGTLNIMLASEPAKLDPALNSSVDGACLAVAAFAGLYSTDENGQPIPDLADSYEMSEDGLTYTFHLKSDLKWSDGSALTANDFIYSWNRSVAEETAADYSYLYDVIARTDTGELDATAPDDNTIVVKVDAPCAYFLDLMAFPAFFPVPQAAVEAANPDGTNPGAWCQEAGFISNGPYVLTSWVHDESMVYEANPNYYDAASVTVSKLNFMLSDDDTAVYAAYQAGDLDFIDSIPTDEISNLIDSKNPEFHIIGQLGTVYMQFNVNSALFEGKTVEQASAMRRALGLLIDRDYIVANIAQAGQELASSFIPSGISDGNGGMFKANDDAYTYPNAEAIGYYDATQVNTEEAIALLEEAGYVFGDDGMLSAETPLVMTYLTNDAGANIPVAEALQQDLAAVGIEMTIDTQEWNVFLENRKAGNFDLARGGWICDYNDPINMLEMFTSDSGNNDAQLGR
ncbi:MAG: ABC transporter substrate-binding protein [Lachnospiraceae bacterium]